MRRSLLSVFAYADQDGAQIIAAWLTGKPPVTGELKDRMSFLFKQGRFTDPVYVDLMTGRVYDIPDDRWKKETEGVSFRELPIPDYPVLIAEKAAVPLRD